MWNIHLQSKWLICRLLKRLLLFVLDKLKRIVVEMLARQLFSYNSFSVAYRTIAGALLLKTRTIKHYPSLRSYTKYSIWNFHLVFCSGELWLHRYALFVVVFFNHLEQCAFFSPMGKYPQSTKTIFRFIAFNILFFTLESQDIWLKYSSGGRSEREARVGKHFDIYVLVLARIAVLLSMDPWFAYKLQRRRINKSDDLLLNEQLTVTFSVLLFTLSAHFFHLYRYHIWCFFLCLYHRMIGER